MFKNAVTSGTLSLETFTRLRLHREVGLPLQDGVDELGVVPEHGVVRIRGRHLRHRGPCWGWGIAESEEVAVPLGEEIK